jgi:putative transposase
VIKNRPRRFDRFYIREPVFYITCCSLDRRLIPQLKAAHRAFVRYGERAEERNIAVGRYVLMPDHLHLFVKGDANFAFALDGRSKTRDGSPASCRSRELWQPGFFDHVLRSDESYTEKWNYVRENPVRAGLVKTADEWPYQGEIVIIDRV